MAQQLNSLDKVQLEINRVLELLGRVFVATKDVNKPGAVAATNKLKTILPLSINNFHSALDELDEQLQFAKLVLRRDLGIATQQKPAIVTTEPDQASKIDSAAVTASPTTDTVDVKDEEAAQQPAAASEEHSKDEASRTTKQDADVEMTDSKQELKIDTQQEIKEPAVKTADDVEEAPDTAFSNNADMDSLFNDPVSAAGDSAANSFHFDSAENGTADFDFGEFAAGLDTNNSENIDGPIQDFNNGGVDTAEVDFSDLFGPATTQNDNTQSQTQDAAQDFNFDDLMDLGIAQSTNDDGNNTADFDLGFS